MSYEPPPQPPYDPSYGQQPPVPGPPQGYGPPPPGFHPAPQQPPAKRKKWPWVLGGIALLCLLVCGGIFAIVGAGTNAVVKGIEEADQNQQGKNAVAGQMDEAIVDGKFQFTVTGMKCGVKAVGGDFGEKAQGEFCLVDVTIKNVGKESEIFADSSQKAYDAEETEFSVDSGAAVYANEDSSTFLEAINPGNQVKGKLVFDVPPGTKLTSVVLHESMFTAGVKIPLQ